MRELSTCDFCGTGAVGVFEVLPPALTPAEDQKRVVLCDHCQATLTDVISPLLTRLGVDADRSSDRQTQSDDQTVPDDPPAELGASATTTSADESTGGVASVDVSAVDAAPSPSESADHDLADTLGDELVADDGSTADDDGSTTNDDEPEDHGADESDTTESAADDTLTEPPKFRKVVRILQNREFPVERADVEALASNAYDLDDEQVADIFDYAVERGLLVDDGGTLRKP
ncbi:hypothetical protein [Haloferax sp. DFSO52]|uniref:hypothetical protein n=1 Tax=Haloferax sp. DFSO52 TaxID=3388505 RepID=UPI003A8B3A44